MRNLNLLECNSKELLQKYGVAIQEFKVLENSPNDAQIINQFGKHFIVFILSMRILNDCFVIYIYRLPGICCKGTDTGRRSR